MSLSSISLMEVCKSYSLVTLGVSDVSEHYLYKVDWKGSEFWYMLLEALWRFLGWMGVKRLDGSSSMELIRAVWDTEY